MYQQCCDALLNMSRVKALQQQLLDSGVAECVKQYEQSDDLKLADAAKGVLLSLKKLKEATEDKAPDINSDNLANLYYDVFLSHKRTEAKV